MFLLTTSSDFYNASPIHVALLYNLLGLDYYVHVRKKRTCLSNNVSKNRISPFKIDNGECAILIMIDRVKLAIIN